MVIALVITIAGLVAIFKLPVAQYPPISPPTVTVETFYVGASARVVEQNVAVPIEQEVNGAENMIYMSSTSTSDGRYFLTCTFKVGTDIDIAQVDVQNRVARADRSLPPEVKAFGITVQKASPDMLMVLSLYSPDNTYDDLFLSNYASLNLYDHIARIYGVGNISIVGEREYAMRLWVRPDRLAAPGAHGPGRGPGGAGPERPGPGRPGGAAPGQGRGEFPVHRGRQGPPHRQRGIRQHHRPHPAGRLGSAGPGHRRHRAGGQALHLLFPAGRQALHHHGDLPAAGGQRSGRGHQDPGLHGRGQKELSPGPGIRSLL